MSPDLLASRVRPGLRFGDDHWALTRELGRTHVNGEGECCAAYYYWCCRGDRLG